MAKNTEKMVTKNEGTLKKSIDGAAAMRPPKPPAQPAGGQGGQPGSSPSNEEK